jgi:sugar phosphate isomerase/epimerase
VKIASHGIGIDTITLFDMPPVEYVHLAADLGIGYISTALAPFVANPHDYASWSLRDGETRAAMIAAMRERGVAIAAGEGFLAFPGKDVSAYAEDLDIMAELGAARVNIVPLDPDRARSFDKCAEFAGLARARGLKAVLEFMPQIAIGDLATAAEVVRHAGIGNITIVVDFMHLIRSGGTAAELAALDPAMIGYAQLCDVPLVSKHPNYGMEARDYRLPPGEGELPIRALWDALPEGVIVGLEVPMLDRAEAGVGPRERIEAVLAGARAVLG